MYLPLLVFERVNDLCCYCAEPCEQAWFDKLTTNKRIEENLTPAIGEASILSQTQHQLQISIRHFPGILPHIKQTKNFNGVILVTVKDLVMRCK